MPSINPIYDPEQEQIAAQLRLADILRQQGMSAKSVGNGGAGMVGKLFVKGNQMGNIAQMLGGAGLDAYSRGQAQDLGTARDAERAQFMSSMPTGVESAPQAGPVQEGQEPLPDVERQMSPRALARATQQWAARAPRGMEGVQNFALQQAMLAPEKEAERAAQAEARAADTAARLESAKVLQQERLDAAAQRAQEQNALRMTLAGMAASNRAAGGGEKAPTAAEIKRQDAEDAKGESRQVAGAMLNQLDTNLDELEKSGGIPSNKKGALSNAVSSARNSWPGQILGSTFATKDQANRNDNESIATGLLMELKNLKGLSASQMNSNMELQRYLTAIKGGTNYDVETMRNITSRARDLLGIPKGKAPVAPTPATDSPKRRKYNPATGDFEQ